MWKYGHSTQKGRFSDAKSKSLDTGCVFLGGFVISKNRTARDHESESMGEYGWYPHSLAGVVEMPERNALGTGASQHDTK